MKCDVSNIMTYASLFATAVTVTMVAKNTVFISNNKNIQQKGSSQGSKTASKTWEKYYRWIRLQNAITLYEDPMKSGIYAVCGFFLFN